MKYDAKDFPLPLGALGGRGMLAASEPGEGAPPEATCNTGANESDLPASPPPPPPEHIRTNESLFIPKDNY